jgi:hypothetical protein
MSQRGDDKGRRFAQQKKSDTSQWRIGRHFCGVKNIDKCWLDKSAGNGSPGELVACLGN